MLAWHNKQTRWNYRLEVYELKLKGLSYREMAKHFSEKRKLAKPLTRASMYEIWQKIKHLTLEEIKEKNEN